jgi:hypothetical protein
MKIDVSSEASVFITINGWVYHIDDSTNEQIVEKWPQCSCTGICSCPDKEVQHLIPAN